MLFFSLTGKITARFATDGTEQECEVTSAETLPLTALLRMRSAPKMTATPAFPRSAGG